MSEASVIHRQIYKRDNNGNVRVWQIEQSGTSYRILSGVKGGATVATGWIHPEGKQGRNDFQQTEFEIRSAYAHHLKREYFESESEIDAPRFFKPMLARKYETFAPGFAQPKLDGVRCVARREGLFTREGQPILGAPHVHEELLPVFASHPDLIIDGELYNHDLRDDFNQIISLVRKKEPDSDHLVRSCRLVQYHAYDLPSSEAVFSHRYAQLADVIAGSSLGVIQLVDTERVEDEAQYDQLHGEWLEAGYEGSMWRGDAQYEQKRSKTLMKRKEFQDAEFEVVSIEEGIGNWAGMAKSVICRLPDGRTFGAGIKGSKERAVELLSEQHKVVTVHFFHMTPDGVPRFPVVTKFWGDERVM